jgi:phage tail protein X
MFHYSTKTTTTTTTPTTTNNNNEEEQQPMVMHKMVIHLPDMKPTKEYAQVVPFLQSAKMTNQTFIYGKNRFNPRYRKQKYDGLNPFFTFAEESVSQSVSPIINWTQP